MTWAVLGSGESLCQEDVDYLKGKCRVVAISNSYLMAPWADALVSHDRAWWRVNKKALEFSGRKICKFDFPGTEKFNDARIPVGSNSGLMGMIWAKSQGAKQIILLGFDMHGTHFFGKHPEPLNNTPDHRFRVHIKQFDKWYGCPVYNCTKGSALKKFPFHKLRDII